MSGLNKTKGLPQIGKVARRGQFIFRLYQSVSNQLSMAINFCNLAIHLARYCQNDRKAIIYSNYCNGHGRLKISSRSEIRINPDFLKIRTYKKGFQPLTPATQAYQERFISLFQEIRKQYAEVGCIIITKKKKK